MPPEVNVLVLLKGQEQYVFVYDDHSHPELLQTIRDHAADPRLSLTWFDANVLTRKARDQIKAGFLAESGEER
ncbi:MAG: hypothetical protein K1X57_15130 [Gemmataceae bacterium]|jgi:hypothetical protein|nr:hypothetical protein [Gemmataceae bacterium]